jgi:hypothetical protein
MTLAAPTALAASSHTRLYMVARSTSPLNRREIRSSVSACLALIRASASWLCRLAINLWIAVEVRAISSCPAINGKGRLRSPLLMRSALLAIARNGMVTRRTIRALNTISKHASPAIHTITRASMACAGA